MNFLVCLLIGIPLAAFGLGLSQVQHMRQEMRMTPQMIQAQELLQLPLQLLEQRISQELLDNPALEMVEMESEEIEDGRDESDEFGDDFENATLEKVIGDSFSSVDQMDYQWSEDFDEPSPRMSSSSDMDDDRFDVIANTPDRPQSLQHFLQGQLIDLDLSPRERLLAERVIFSLDDRGYLVESLCSVFSRNQPFQRDHSLSVNEGIPGHRLREAVLTYLSLGAIDYSEEIKIITRFMSDLAAGDEASVVRVLCREYQDSIHGSETDAGVSPTEKDPDLDEKTETKYGESGAKTRDRYAKMVHDLMSLMWRGVEDEICSFFITLQDHLLLHQQSPFLELLLRQLGESWGEIPLARKLLTSHLSLMASQPMAVTAKELDVPLERLRSVSGLIAYRMENEVQNCLRVFVSCDTEVLFPKGIRSGLIERLKEASLPDEVALLLVESHFDLLASGRLSAAEEAACLRPVSSTSAILSCWCILEDEFFDGLAAVQLMEPAGVACRDLQSCLLLQVRRLKGRYDFEAKMIEQHLDDLAANRLPKVARSMNCTLEEVKDVIELIKTLNPDPGLIFVDPNSNQIIPDIEVRYEEGEFVIRLYSGNIPELRVNPLCKEILRAEDTESDAKKYMREKIFSAEWIIRSIEQRNRTIQNVTKEIVLNQREYLLGQESKPGPLEMQSVANRVGVDISTVSRAVREKYAVTPRGIVCLRDMFTRKVSGGIDSTENTSNVQIMEKIRLLIEGEDPKKPLKDGQIERLLKADGIDIVRRTVAKYRQNLGLGSYSQRRKY